MKETRYHIHVELNSVVEGARYNDLKDSANVIGTKLENLGFTEDMYELYGPVGYSDFTVSTKNKYDAIMIAAGLDKVLGPASDEWRMDYDVKNNAYAIGPYFCYVDADGDYMEEISSDFGVIYEG